MTLPSLRNPQITRLNIRRLTLLDRLAPTLGIALILCLTTSVNAQSTAASSKADEASGTSKLSPLERLKQRSPIKRWNEISIGWPKNKPADAQPAKPASSPQTDAKDFGRSTKPNRPDQRSSTRRNRPAAQSSTATAISDPAPAGAANQEDLEFLPPIKRNPPIAKLPSIEQRPIAQTPRSTRPFSSFFKRRHPVKKPAVRSPRTIVTKPAVPDFRHKSGITKSLRAPLPSLAKQSRTIARRPIVKAQTNVKDRPASTPTSKAQATPATTPVKLVQATETQAPQDGDAPLNTEPVRDPKQLKKLTSILPYFDYEPNEEARMNTPCVNICPRPDGAPCKPPEGGTVPECPEEVALGGGPYEGRLFGGTLFQWKASDLYHNPLYFEDPGLERYGHTHGDWVQPFVSAGRFSVQLVGLPYQMTIDPLCKRMYALGYYRPGDCAPKKYYQIPWNRDAALVQGAVVSGLFFVVP